LFLEKVNLSAPELGTWKRRQMDQRQGAPPEFTVKLLDIFPLLM
jgi:hypothetical protein